MKFADAVKTACESADVRIRLGSLEPESMDMETLKEFAKYKNFCPQFHLSLQSGCDETLKRMNRHYTSAEYAEIVGNIRKVFDNPSITTDVMVGFAGESDEEFKKSLSFVKSIGFAKVHIFPYSRRKGTVADKYENQISPDVKKARASEMAEETALTSQAFLKSQVGRIEKVLIETRNKNGRYEGYTMNYTPVFVEADESYINEVVDVLITGVENEYCTGQLAISN